GIRHALLYFRFADAFLPRNFLKSIPLYPSPVQGPLYLTLARKKPSDDSAVYQFMQKKLLEGKRGKTAKIAGLNKFLRIYYARVLEVYGQINQQTIK
ncbi:MAG: hypothetical protein LBS19_03415, partial [Clostridiales bacterium]|nr:hypothetical protein [Clostridiales bacterium]